MFLARFFVFTQQGILFILSSIFLKDKIVYFFGVCSSVLRQWFEKKYVLSNNSRTTVEGLSKKISKNTVLFRCYFFALNDII